MKDGLNKLRQTSLAILHRLRFAPPLLGRLVLGWIFARSGWGKLHNLPQVIQFFTELGIPLPHIQAPFVAGVELVGGLLLLAGLLTRLATVPLMGTMVVALLTAQREQTSSLGDLFGTVEFLYLSLLLWLAIGGPGRVALDTIVARWLDRPEGRSEAAVPPAGSMALGGA